MAKVTSTWWCTDIGSACVYNGTKKECGESLSDEIKSFTLKKLPAVWNCHSTSLETVRFWPLKYSDALSLTTRIINEGSKFVGWCLFLLKISKITPVIVKMALEILKLLKTAGFLESEEFNSYSVTKWQPAILCPVLCMQLTTSAPEMVVEGTFVGVWGGASVFIVTHQEIFWGSIW